MSESVKPLFTIHAGDVGSEAFRDEYVNAIIRQLAAMTAERDELNELYGAVQIAANLSKTLQPGESLVAWTKRMIAGAERAEKCRKALEEIRDRAPGDSGGIFCYHVAKRALAPAEPVMVGGGNLCAKIKAIQDEVVPNEPGKNDLTIKKLARAHRLQQELSGDEPGKAEARKQVKG